MNKLLHNNQNLFKSLLIGTIANISFLLFFLVPFLYVTEFFKELYKMHIILVFAVLFTHFTDLKVLSAFCYCSETV